MRTIFLAVMAFYFVVHLLLLVRLVRLTKGRYAKWVTALVFLLLASAFPLGEIWDSRSHSFLSQLLVQAGYYYLPFMLYFLLLFLVYGLLSVPARLFISRLRSVFKSPSVRLWSMAMMAFVSVVIVILGHANFNRTRISPYHADVPAGTSTMNGLKIAMAADLHINAFTSMRFMDQFVEKINALQVDIVLLPGDILEGIGEAPHLAPFERKLSEIRSRYGVFASPGNHERYGTGRLEDSPFFKNAGIHMLIDADTLIAGGFRVAGLGVRDNDSTRVAAMFQRMRTDSLPGILMRHIPGDDEMLEYARPDVQVSGHTHNGQLWPLNFITSAVYELSWGHMIIQDCHVFVTCGAQGWGPPVRTGSHSEIMEINLSFVKERNEQ